MVCELVPLLPSMPAPVCHWPSLKPGRFQLSAGLLSVYFNVYTESSAPGAIGCNAPEGMPMNLYTFPSTHTSPINELSLPVQCLVVDSFSLSENDQILK